MDIQEETQKNIEALKKAIGNQIICPICQNTQFAILNGYFRHDIQTDLDNLTLGGPGIEMVVLIYKKCGFVSQYVLVLLQENISK